MKRSILLAAAVIAGLAACSDSTGSRNGTARTQVLLSDAPFPFDSIARVDVYVARIEASTSLDTSQTGSDGWVTVAEPQQAFNLLDFQNGTTVLAGETDIPAGQYRAIRLTINTSLSHVTAKSGADVPVIWPVSGELALNAYVEHALDVSRDGARIVIDFDVGRSFLLFESAPFQLVFSPWIRAVNDAAAGGISGRVTVPDIEGHQTPLANVPLVLQTSPGPGAMPAKVGVAQTDADGRYHFAWVSAGGYGVGIESSPGYINRGVVGVEVHAGQVSVVNFALDRDTSGGSGGGVDTSLVSPGGPVASVTLRIGTPSGSTAIQKCDSIPMTAELRNAQGQILLSRPIAWSTTDSSVLTLQGVFGQYANLRALKAGSATIAAASEGKSASVTFTVTGTNACSGGGGGGAVDTVRISPNPARIYVGFDTIAASAILRSATGEYLSGRTVTWSIGDTSVASIISLYPHGSMSVDVHGKVPGTTTLTATSEGKTNTVPLNVLAHP